MKKLIWILFLITNISLAQSNEKFLMDFLLEDELRSENALTEYNQYDFSKLWSITENHRIFGIIGADHQRIKIKLISIKKDTTKPNEYLISGKSFVKGTICDINGKSL